MERFTKKDIFCLGCNKYHSFDMILKQVVCPNEHPLDYTKNRMKRFYPEVVNKLED